MTPKQTGGAPPVIDPDNAVPPSLDRSRIQSEHCAATHRLLARLKALKRSQETQTPRAYARRYVREQESLILGLLNAGVGTEEILADITLGFPSIPMADFRHAVAQLRDWHCKQIGVTSIGTASSLYNLGGSDPWSLSAESSRGEVTATQPESRRNIPAEVPPPRTLCHWSGGSCLLLAPART